MKKCVSVILFLAFLVGIMPASAISIEPANEFGIVETTLEDGSEMRVYHRNEAELMAISEQAADNHEKTKRLLSAIGIDQVIIDHYSEEELMTFADSQEITVTTAYIKTDAEGNSVNLSKEQMLSELEKLGATAGTNMIDDPTIGGGGEVFTGTDSYMEVKLTVARQQGAQYFFAADATWLTMPRQRWTDAIGICAMEIAPEVNTCQGFYTYDQITYYQGETTTKSITSVFDSSNITPSLSNGTWEGAGAHFDIINVPQDSNAPGYNFSITNTNLHAHFQFYANIRDYSNSKYFNVSANYAHTTFVVNASPSLTISGSIGNNNDPSVSASVGVTFSPEIKSENHYVISSHNINYVP